MHASFPVLLALCLSGLPVACRAPGDSGEPTTFTALSDWGEYTLSPYGGFTAQFLVFLPLIRKDADEEIEGLLARSWEHDPTSDRWQALHWNHRLPALRDRRVRQALTMAIDRRALIELLYLPADIPILDVPPTRRQIRDRAFPDPWPYDPERTIARQKEGRQAGFTAIVAEAFGGLEAVYIQDALRRIGVRMEIQRLPGFAAVRDRLEDGDFEAAFHRVSEGTLSQYLGEDSPVGYENPEFKELLSAWDAAWDPDERAGLYLRAAEIFQRDVSATLLLPSLQTTVAHRRVRGLSSPHRVFPIWFMDELWIDERGE